ncbi:PIF1 [Symbiodinium sp. CCMP2592]|nr:PIF1 [Symbiodinium sp. CCMP2592]
MVSSVHSIVIALHSQELLAKSTATLTEVYQLVPEVSLGRVSAQQADEAIERLHNVFGQLLERCDNVSWMERQAAEVLDANQLHIWRKHLDIVLWTRAWSALRAQQRKTKSSNAESKQLSEAEAESIVPAAAPLGNAFMCMFQEELRAEPDKKAITEAEQRISQAVQALLEQSFSWDHIFEIPDLLNFPATAAERFLELMQALQLSREPAASEASNDQVDFLARAAPYDPLSEGVIASEDEIANRGHAGVPLLPEGAPQPVPPDGLCLSYACVGAQNPRYLAKMHRDRSGFVVDEREASRFRTAALNFRAAVAVRARRAARADIATALQSGDWPSEAALHFFAEELGGSLMVTSLFSEEKMLFGQGPITVHVLHGVTEPDADGHSSGHFELLQSWLPADEKPSSSRTKKKRSSSLRDHEESESSKPEKKKPKPGKHKAGSAAMDSNVSGVRKARDFDPEEPGEAVVFNPDEIREDSHAKEQHQSTAALVSRASGNATPTRRTADVGCGDMSKVKRISKAKVAKAVSQDPLTSQPPLLDSSSEAESAEVSRFYSQLLDEGSQEEHAEPLPDKSVPERRSALKTSSLYRAQQRKAQEDEAWQTWLANPEIEATSKDFAEEAEAWWQDYEEQRRAKRQRSESNIGWTDEKPKHGDRILVLRQPYLGWILAGTKTLEIRDKPLRAQHVWLGHKELILGRAYMDGAEQILTDEEWKRLLPQHRWDRTARPYKRTYGLRLSQVCRTRRPHEYTHPLGAIGMVVYREETRPEACNTEAVVQQSKLCPGRHEEACRFHRDGSGRPAGPSKHSKTGRCMFCDATALREVHRVAPSTITRALNNLKAKAAEVHRLARTRVQETLEAFSSVVSLEDRICHVALSDTEVQEAAKARDNDAKRARRKFPTLYEDEGQHGDWQSTAAKTFQKWAEEESWTTCPGCKRLRTQRFPAGSRRSNARCNHCAKGAGYVAPTPGDVPLALRGMSRVVLECLRPFSISCGPGERSPSGYWVHTAPIRFRWKSATLTERIASLEVERERKHAQVASEWLLQNEESAYKKFNALQEAYVMASQQQEDAEETPSTDLMPLRFMETVGIECAAWPHLYWKTAMCETFVRSRDSRRLKRTADDQSDSDENEEGVQKHQSFKASYITKVLSPLIGYGVDFELTQFVYDLWLYTGIGSADRASGLSLRAALAGKSFAPEYWRTKHAALIDLQKQLGPPTLFLTIAPYEWTAPYHTWLLDEMCKAARSRTNLPVAESLHLAHLLTEVVRELLMGQHSTDEMQGLLGEKVVYFARLEFQDGTVHVHVLVWLREDADKGRLPRLISAELPPAGTPLGDLVRGSQLDRHDSAWPRREEASIWDTVSQTLQLKHPRDAWEAKVRAYMPDVLGCLRCHMDVQASDGRGMILRYATGYISKFSQLWSLEGQLDKRDIAHSILWQYHPLEMEMVLQLASHILPQCNHTGHIRRFVVPVPWSSGRLPREIELYEKSTWRADTVPLLEFLRRSNAKGEISWDIRRRYEDEKPSCSLNEFANKCSTQGNTMVATVLYARSNDNFFKQWLLLNVPFRSLDNLWHPTVDEIPEDLQGLALCLHHCPRYWQSMPAIRQEMEAEAWKDYHIENVISSVKAKTETIAEIRTGNYKPPIESSREKHVAAVPNESELSVEQQHMVQAISDRVTKAAERRCGGTVAADQWNEHVRRENDDRAICCLGAAGTGKSVAVKTVITKVQDRANVAIACPTGLLAASYRRSFTGAHIDTVHGFFALHVEEHLTVDLLADYDLVVVEEIGQLTRTQFERIMRLWLAADQRPCLVFLGDFKQLPSIDNTNAKSSSLCNYIRWVELRQVQRNTCPELRRKLALLRDCQPTEAQLQAILRGHSVSNGDRPTREEVAGVLEGQREVTMVTFTRRAAEELNQMAVQIQFGDHEPLRIIPTDPDANCDNKQRGEYVNFDCSSIALHIGMKLMLTRNVNKEGDHVNGMFCHLEAVGRHGIRVRTATNKIVLVCPQTETQLLSDGSVARATFYPLRLGYATTLHKLQGATLDYMALWLDQEGIQGAGYVALSRVRKDTDWCFLGRLKPTHFCPSWA